MWVGVGWCGLVRRLCVARVGLGYLGFACVVVVWLVCVCLFGVVGLFGPCWCVLVLRYDLAWFVLVWLVRVVRFGVM